MQPALGRQVTPSLASRLARPGDGEGAPELLARFDIVSGNVAAARKCRVAGPATDGLAVDYQRADRLTDDLEVTDGGLPNQLTRPRIKRNDVGIIGGVEDLILVDGHVASNVPNRADNRAVDIYGKFAPVLPDEITRGRI